MANRRLIMKDGREIDFLLEIHSEPYALIESKWSDATPSKNFATFDKELAVKRKIQLLGDLKQEATYPNGVEVRLACSWLSSLSSLMA